MARPGYKEAKAAVEKATSNRDQMRIERDNIDALEIPESLKIARRGDWQRGLDQAEIELAEAQAAFAAFNVKPASVRREYFDSRLNLCISMSSTLQLTLLQAARDNSVSIAEIVRRALVLYFTPKQSECQTPENKESSH
jgi:hypothetical protein